MTRTPPAMSVLSGVLGAALLGTVLAAVPGGPLLTAVVSYDGPVAGVAGVDVVSPFPTLQMAVVTGRADALARLARTPGVRGVSPDVAVELTGRPDRSRAQGVLASRGLGGDAGQAGAGAGVRVAVVDTGVSDSPALNRASGRLVDAADSSAVTDGGGVRTGGRYLDGFGHGTFMASVVAGGVVPGTRGQALGVAPGATVLVVRVAKADGATSLSRVVGGLEWIAAHPDQVDVASLSFSHKRPHNAYGPDPLTDAVEQVRHSGVTVVVSSGNKAGTVGDPGFDPRVLTVGAADLDRRRVAGFSGSDDVHGVTKPDVVASGLDVLGVLPPSSVLAQSSSTTHLDDGLFRGTGTSQATAITSGLAALLLRAHPEATPAQVKASLRCAATDLRGKRDGAGLVSATTTLCSGPEGEALDGSGDDLTGEVDFDASSWSASSWSASSWSASSWSASSWSASSWSASSWSKVDPADSESDEAGDADKAAKPEHKGGR